MGNGQATATSDLIYQRNQIVTKPLPGRQIYKEQILYFQLVDRGAITVKENPRFNSWDMADDLTPELRQRQLHGEDMKCGNQPANIRMISRRFNDPASNNELEIIA
jgi:hypothetical protein